MTGLAPPACVALRSVAGGERALSQWGEVQGQKQHRGSLFWPRRWGVEKVVIFALEPSVNIARRQRARPGQTAAAPGEPAASWWPAVGLAASCCSMALALAHFLSSACHASQSGQRCRGEPPKDARGEGPQLRHHSTPGTAGCPSSRGQDKGCKRVALDAESGYP